MTHLDKILCPIPNFKTVSEKPDQSLKQVHQELPKSALASIAVTARRGTKAFLEFALQKPDNAFEEISEEVFSRLQQAEHSLQPGKQYTAMQESIKLGFMGRGALNLSNLASALKKGDQLEAIRQHIEQGGIDFSGSHQNAGSQLLMELLEYLASPAESAPETHEDITLAADRVKVLKDINPFHSISKDGLSPAHFAIVHNLTGALQAFLHSSDPAVREKMEAAIVDFKALGMEDDIPKYKRTLHIRAGLQQALTKGVRPNDRPLLEKFESFMQANDAGVKRDVAREAWEMAAAFQPFSHGSDNAKSISRLAFISMASYHLLSTDKKRDALREIDERSFLANPMPSALNKISRSLFMLQDSAKSAYLSKNDRALLKDIVLESVTCVAELSSKSSVAQLSDLETAYAVRKGIEQWAHSARNNFQERGSISTTDELEMQVDAHCRQELDRTHQEAAKAPFNLMEYSAHSLEEKCAILATWFGGKPQEYARFQLDSAEGRSQLALHLITEKHAYKIEEICQRLCISSQAELVNLGKSLNGFSLQLFLEEITIAGEEDRLQFGHKLAASRPVSLLDRLETLKISDYGKKKELVFRAAAHLEHDICISFKHCNFLNDNDKVALLSFLAEHAPGSFSASLTSVFSDWEAFGKCTALSQEKRIEFLSRLAKKDPSTYLQNMQQIDRLAGIGPTEAASLRASALENFSLMMEAMAKFVESNPELRPLVNIH